jgi:colicin import membrane protein
MRPGVFRRRTKQDDPNRGGHRKAIGAAVITGVLVAGGVAGVQFANASTTPRAAGSTAAKAQAAKKAAAAKARTLLGAAENIPVSCNILTIDAVAAKEIKLSKRENARELEAQNRKLAVKLAKELAAADPRVPAKDKKAAKEAARAAALLATARADVLLGCLNLADVELATGTSIATTPPTASPTSSASASASSSAAPSSSATRHF